MKFGLTIKLKENGNLDIADGMFEASLTNNEWSDVFEYEPELKESSKLYDGYYLSLEAETNKLIKIETRNDSEMKGWRIEIENGKKDGSFTNSTDFEYDIEEVLEEFDGITIKDNKTIVKNGFDYKLLEF